MKKCEVLECINNATIHFYPNDGHKNVYLCGDCFRNSKDKHPKSTYKIMPNRGEVKK